jgi:hypothetical protein
VNLHRDERHDPLDASGFFRIGCRKQPNGDLPVLLGELHEEGLRAAFFHCHAVDKRSVARPVDVDIDHFEDLAAVSHHGGLDALQAIPRSGASSMTIWGIEVGPVGYLEFSLSERTLLLTTNGKEPPVPLFAVRGEYRSGPSFTRIVQRHCNPLFTRDLAGARGFEPRASCAQDKR